MFSQTCTLILEGINSMKFLDLCYVGGPARELQWFLLALYYTNNLRTCDWIVVATPLLFREQALWSQWSFSGKAHFNYRLKYQTLEKDFNLALLPLLALCMSLIISHFFLVLLNHTFIHCHWIKSQRIINMSINSLMYLW